jgi:polyhydroxybutyrate depolymerase
LVHLSLPLAGFLTLALLAPAAAGTTTTTSTTTAAPATTSTTVPLPAVVASPGCLRASAPPVAPGASTTLNLTLAKRSLSGTYILTVPKTYRRGRPTPLVFLFHGDDSSAAAFAAETNFPAQGAAAGDIVVMPNNQPNEIGFQYSGTGTDATFVDAVIGAVERSYCVNTRTVFTSGFSSGAAFAILYACFHQGQIRAIATGSVDYQLGCTRPVSLLAFHGTADGAVTYQPNTVVSQLPGIKLDAHEVLGTVQNMRAWAKLDRCEPKPTVTRIGSQVSRSQWLTCAPGTSVTFYTVLGGGHEWPGADTTTGYGFTTQQISANKLIVKFFNSFS